MTFTATGLPGSYIVDLAPFRDQRGWFARTYCKKEFAEIQHEAEWVQINHSFTQKKGAIRGMHFQRAPYQEIKLVRCIAGSVFDVIVDLREGSETFLLWFGTNLSAENRKMMYIPPGFAHGFQTLTETCELIYHHSEFYNPAAEGGVRYDDPVVRIAWPLPVTDLSQRDEGYPLLDNNFKGI